VPRRGVASADEVDPEGLLELGAEEVHLHRHVLSTCGGLQGPVGAQDPFRDHGVLDAGVGGDHVDRLLPFARQDLGDGQPDELQHGRRVLAAAVADDPGDAVRQVEVPDLGLEGLHHRAHAMTAEGLRALRRFAAHRRPFLKDFSTASSSGSSSMPKRRFTA
jgi:hypothetical protein